MISLFFVILVCVAVVLVATSGNINLALPPATAADRPRNAKLGALVARYDPTRDWKREHRIALIGAIALGFMIGLVFGISRMDFQGYWWGNAVFEFQHGRYTDRYLVPFYWTLFWTLFGGIVGGSIVGITLLLRK
jgi:hypothetical protein